MHAAAVRLPAGRQGFYQILSLLFVSILLAPTTFLTTMPRIVG
jgi:hypothetical protein